MHTFTRAVRALIAGNTDTAEQLATEALRIGTDSGQPDAATFHFLQSMDVSWQRGTMGELAPVIEQAVAENPGLPGSPSNGRAGVARRPPAQFRATCQDASQADEAIRFFDETSDIRWSHPLASERRQVIVSRPTGDSASLSDVHRHFVLPGLGEQVAKRWHAKALDSFANVGLHQLRGVSGQYEADCVTHFQGAVHGEVNRDGCAGRVG